MVLPERWLGLDAMQVPGGDGGQTRLDRAGVLRVIRETQRQAETLKPEKIRDRKVRLAHVSNGYQGGQVVVGAYENAQVVMAETVAGLKADLTQFATDLQACLDEIDGADGLSAATLAKMAEVAPSSQHEVNHQTASSQTGFQVNDTAVEDDAAVGDDAAVEGGDR